MTALAIGDDAISLGIQFGFDLTSLCQPAFALIEQITSTMERRLPREWRQTLEHGLDMATNRHDLWLEGRLNSYLARLSKWTGDYTVLIKRYRRAIQLFAAGE